MTHAMVVYASRHGATQGIAQRIGEALRGEGLEVTVADARTAPDPRLADAVVLGSAAYMGKWLDEATDYLRRNHDALAERPTWLFSSGPVGTETVDGKGNDMLATPPFVTTMARGVAARGTRVFFGRWDPSDPPQTLVERLFQKLPLARDRMPVGDFRDWPTIDAWAREIAQELVREPAPAG